MGFYNKFEITCKDGYREYITVKIFTNGKGIDLKNLEDSCEASCVKSGIYKGCYKSVSSTLFNTIVQKLELLCVGLNPEEPYDPLLDERSPKEIYFKIPSSIFDE